MYLSIFSFSSVNFGFIVLYNLLLDEHTFRIFVLMNLHVRYYEMSPISFFLKYTLVIEFFSSWLVPSSQFLLPATLCSAEQNPAGSFCSILSSFGAVSDDALPLLIGFSRPIFSEACGQVHLPGLS